MSERSPESFNAMKSERDHILRLFYETQEAVIAEQEKLIIIEAQRDQLLASNARQAKTIAEQDTALRNAAERCRWLQEQARVFKPEPGCTYGFKPKVVTVVAHLPGVMTTFEFDDPECITLTF